MKTIIKTLKIIFLLWLTLFMIIFISALLFAFMTLIAEHFEFGYNIGDIYHCPNYLLNMLVPLLAYLMTYLILFMSVHSKKMFLTLVFLPTLWYVWIFGDLFYGAIHDIGPGAIELPTNYESILVLGVNICMLIGLGWMFKKKER